MVIYNIVLGTIFLVSLGIFVFISVDWKAKAEEFGDRKKEMTFESSEEKK